MVMQKTQTNFDWKLGNEKNSNLEISGDYRSIQKQSIAKKIDENWYGFNFFFSKQRGKHAASHRLEREKNLSINKERSIGLLIW